MKDRPEYRSALVAIIGVGYVRRALALASAEAGLSVLGLDVQQERVDAVNHGRAHQEKGRNEISMVQ